MSIEKGSKIYICQSFVTMKALNDHLLTVNIKSFWSFRSPGIPSSTLPLHAYREHIQYPYTSQSLLSPNIPDDYKK